MQCVQELKTFSIYLDRMQVSISVTDNSMSLSEGEVCVNIYMPFGSSLI